MRTVSLGTTGIRVSNLCLGTMQFGWTTDERGAFAVLDAFVAAGGTFIDTADIYSRWAEGNPGGVSEEILGRWMKARGLRDRLVIATKVRGQMPMPDGTLGEGLGRAHILRSIDESLRRLQTGHVDLYQCHWPDEAAPIEETLAALGEVVAAGKARAIGASNYSALDLQRALDAAVAHGTPRFATLQPKYHLVHRREYEAELASLCLRERIAVIPYSPLAAGFLTGKYRRGAPSPESARAGRAQQYLDDRGVAVLEALDAVARARATTLSAVALAWNLSRPAIVAPIVGANTPAQLADALPGADLALRPDEIARLDAASAGA